MRLRYAGVVQTSARAPSAPQRDPFRLGPSDDATAERERWPVTAVDTPAALTARRLAEVRMRLAHRAAGTEAAVARSIVPGDALPAGAARAKVYRGEERAARRVIERVGPIVAQVSSWAGLHAALARHGVTYQAKGSGAVFVVDGIAVKASICRAANRTRVEQRLGPFQPGPEDVEMRPYPDRPRMRATARASACSTRSSPAFR